MPWETVEISELNPEQRRLLRDLNRHGSLMGVPERTHSRFDLSRLGAFEAKDPDAIPDMEALISEATTEFSLASNAVEEATRAYVEKQEAAILGTEWDEWDIVDIVEWVPVTSSDLPEFEVYRYRRTAPPVEDYADGERRYSVTRVTEPLLRKLLGDLREEDALPERYEHYADELLGGT